MTHSSAFVAVAVLFAALQVAFTLDFGNYKFLDYYFKHTRKKLLWSDYCQLEINMIIC